MPYYLTLFAFIFILKLQIQKSKRSLIWLWYKLGRSGYQNSIVYGIRKGNLVCEALLQTLSVLHR
jgi:hypothetical protein